MNHHQGILPRIISWLLFLFVAMGMILPEVRIFMDKPDRSSFEEQSCATIAAYRFVYKNEIERAFIRNWTVRRAPGMEPFHYEVNPVTFFALPWRKVIAQCRYDGESGSFHPVSAWPANAPRVR